MSTRIQTAGFGAVAALAVVATVFLSDLIPLGGRGAAQPRKEEEVRAVRKEEREPVRVVAPLGVQLRDLPGLAAVLGHSRERAA